MLGFDTDQQYQSLIAFHALNVMWDELNLSREKPACRKGRVTNASTQERRSRKGRTRLGRFLRYCFGEG